ncbi:hypothetical protein BU24DRAFT_286310 [Aaosphaeria arxii CBS 175.79]|uniref:G-protein coupled receptors family 1 profile domain-containing protein n=1 Tax=Aaosphaeria arxii CBS 175.79 TaxID=1450172 RepID=A0A6A5XFP8_9PLEO|nr:uncharacterized protein BU24DRAFT_286310 [Aaosphaeria arxii CBS 175.79]KAF2011651.1 hypothetical protein BU24DRAFT_286310 [Aaosphaeria arxii CBS 175.79]
MAQEFVPAKVPLAGNVFSVILSMSTFAVLAVCLTRRVQNVKKWRQLPLASILLLVIYIDSTLFIIATSIIARGVGINTSPGICEGGILLCLVCYMTTKVLIYYFLVERAYIIRGSRLSRLKDKLYCFNCFGMLIPYVIVIILNFVWRISYINDDGVCIIGMEKRAMMPLIIFDVVLNVYLTCLFIVPLRKLYSYQHDRNHSLRRMATRSFIGAVATLLSSVVNLTVLMVLKGEPGWICLMCCNADILFCVLVLHWLTQSDSSRTGSTNGSNHAAGDQENPHPNFSRFSIRQPTRPRPASLPGWAARRLTEPRKILSGTITTECRSDPQPEVRKSEDPNFLELHAIRVDTEQTREIEMNEGSTVEICNGGESRSETDVNEEVGGTDPSRVSVEKMV